MRSTKTVTKLYLKISPTRTKRLREEKLRLCQAPSRKKMKVIISQFHITQEEALAFLSLFDEKVISEFLLLDCCYRVSDKYLLAMVLTYFKRASLPIKEYTVENFFIALYLANDNEEDEEDYKYEIFPWALGSSWKDNFKQFLVKRVALFGKMNFRGAVSRKCCEEVMMIDADHYIWQRERNEYHAGATRTYLKSPAEKEPFPRGPGRSPIGCSVCPRTENSSGYFSDDNDTFSNDEPFFFEISRAEDSPNEFSNVLVNSPQHQVQKSIPNEDDVFGQLASDSFDMDKLWETLN